MANDVDWKDGTWEGSRRAQLRRALRLTVRERLEVMGALSEASEQLARAKPGGVKGDGSEGRTNV